MKNNQQVTSRLSRIEVLRPELGLWGGVLLLLSFLFMTSAKFTDGLPVVQLPSAHDIIDCSRREAALDIGLSMDVAGRVYLHSADSRVQRQLVEAIAAKQGMHFTTDQRQQLSRLSYVGLPVQQLPAYLALSDTERRNKQLAGIPADELSAYLAAARLRATKGFYRPNLYVYLRLDERLPAGQVTQLLGLLEQHQIYRFTLVAVSKK